MKILVLELARFGDIFQTWPALRALKRQHPQSQVHVLTREKYVGALEGLTAVDQIRLLPSQSILEPLIAHDEIEIKQSFDQMSAFIDTLKNEKYDWIVNFSFSPLSSYITHLAAGPQTRVSGYTRHADGYLSIPDDMSAYFYAQVGNQRHNRFHLAEIFGTLVEADLIPSDWAAPQGFANLQRKTNQVLFHIGGSENHKAVPVEKMAEIIRDLLQSQSDIQVGLIGAGGEMAAAETIYAKLDLSLQSRVMNCVGQTSIPQLFQLIAEAQVLVGPDSAPMHMASLVQTPCVNLSLGRVNFWETGPRAAGSVVLRANTGEQVNSWDVLTAIEVLRNKRPIPIRFAKVIPHTPSYYLLEPKDQDFEWKFIQAIYMNEPFPETENTLLRDGFAKLADINQLMIDQMIAMQNGIAAEKVAAIIDSGEEIIQTIGQLVPTLSILVRWYQTEKVRLAPGEAKELLEKTLQIHRTLQRVCDLYLPASDTAERPSIAEEQV